MVIFVILVVVVIAIVLSDSANKKKREEEERQEVQKAKADVASVSQSIFRLLEALDILESVLNCFRFYRDIGVSLQTHDSVFEIQCIIIKSGREPSVEDDLNSIIYERGLRIAAKKSGKTLSTARSPDNYTVWRDLTNEQIEMLYDMMIDLDQQRDNDNDIMLKGSLPLRFENPSSRNSYIRRANMYVKALAEAIHAKFPEYGFEATTTGIYFHDKNGVVSYNSL